MKCCNYIFFLSRVPSDSIVFLLLPNGSLFSEDISVDLIYICLLEGLQEVVGREILLEILLVLLFHFPYRIKAKVC